MDAYAPALRQFCDVFGQMYSVVDVVELLFRADDVTYVMSSEASIHLRTYYVSINTNQSIFTYRTMCSLWHFGLSLSPFLSLFIWNEENEIIAKTKERE